MPKGHKTYSHGALGVLTRDYSTSGAEEYSQYSQRVRSAQVGLSTGIPRAAHAPRERRAAPRLRQRARRRPAPRSSPRCTPDVRHSGGERRVPSQRRWSACCTVLGSTRDTLEYPTASMSRLAHSFQSAVLRRWAGVLPTASDSPAVSRTTSYTWQRTRGTAAIAAAPQNAAAKAVSRLCGSHRRVRRRRRSASGGSAKGSALSPWRGSSRGRRGAALRLARKHCQRLPLRACVCACRVTVKVMVSPADQTSARGALTGYSGGTNPVLTGYSCCAPVARRARRTETVRSVNTVNTHSCETAAPMKSANGSVGAEGCDTWRGGLHRAQRHMAGRVATCGGEMQRAHELRASQACCCASSCRFSESAAR